MSVKKRITSFVLAVMMILTAFPAASVAASEPVDSESVSESTSSSTSVVSGPTLKAVYWSEELRESFDAGMFDHIEATFYLDDGTNRELVSPSDLSFPACLELKNSYDSGTCVIYAAHTGTGDITYTKEGVSYKLPVTVSLPDLGIYTSTDFTEANLADSFRLSASNTKFYVALSPELVEQGYKMTSVETNLDGEIQTPSITTVATAKVSADGSYATVQVTDLSADGYYHFLTTVSLSGVDAGGFRRSLNIENDMPKLYFCDAENYNGEWTFSKSGWPNLNCVPGDNYIGCFYYGSRSQIENGSAELVSADKLSSPAYLTVEEGSAFDSALADIDGVVRIHVNGFAAADDASGITYDRGSDTVTFSVETALPAVGFYTESTASEDAYIYEDKPFTVTEDNRTVYLCVKDTDTTIVGIREWYTDGQEDLFDVTPSGDASYLQFTLKEGASVPSFGAGVNVELSVNSDGNPRTYGSGVQLSLKNGIPSLMAHYLDWDESTQKWVLAESQRTVTSITLFSGASNPTAFLYGTEESYVPVDFSDLSFTDGVIRCYEENGAVWIKAVAYEGTGAVTYEKDGVSVSLPVTVTPPYFGLYSSSTASAGTYLGDEISVGSEGGTFYIISGDGLKDFEVTQIWFEGSSSSRNATDDFVINYSDDGSYATLATKSGALPMGGNYRVSVSGDNFGNYSFEFDLVRTDLTKLTTPSNLLWHTVYTQSYDEEGGWAEEAHTRMGGISFMPGETTQNRFTIELYSSDDNYTTPICKWNWYLGDDTSRVTHFSASSFIYEDLPSGTYKFRARALADGVNYSDSEWSELSEAWTYTCPSQCLQAPDASDFDWVKRDGCYGSSWKGTGEDAVGYYEIQWHSYKEGESSGNFDIPPYDSDDGVFTADLPDEFLQKIGNTDIYFRVRAIPSDITEYRVSEFSYSDLFDVNKVTLSVNDKLENIIDNAQTSAQTSEDIIKQVQSTFEDDTGDLRTAMAADLDGTGGQASGTLEKIEKLESAVSDAVNSDVKVTTTAPAEIQSIQKDVTVVGASLNVKVDTESDSEEKPSVTLVISEPDKDSVIDTQERNAVQFSMKLSGAVDRDDDATNGQQLIVPIVIDTPVPESINPNFLVILHKLSSGEIEQIRPHIYLNEDDNRFHARFIVSSFSVFAFVEYDFGFETDALTKYTDSGAFTLAASGNAAGSTVRYESSDPDVASVDPDSGLVTIHKAGKTTITAIASKTEVFPEATAGYELTVETAQSGSSGTVPGTKTDTKPDKKADDGDKLNFSDVQSGVFYTDAVKWAVENSITKGTGDGTTFSPDNRCTRAEMAVFLWRAAGQPEPKSTGSFSDVAEDTYYAKAIAWAVENGITKGTGDGTTFSPNDSCTRAQMVTFLCRLAAGKTSGSSVTFTDVTNSAYYADAVKWAVENGITNGTGDGTTFSPDDLCTRAQMVTFLYRYFVKQSEDESNKQH